MQNVQNTAFIETFMTEASIFGLHLDATPDNSNSFQSVEGEILVAKVLDLTDTYVLVLSMGRVLVIDCSIGMSVPDRWESRVVSTVDELAEYITIRRKIQTGRWN